MRLPDATQENDPSFVWKAERTYDYVISPVFHNGYLFGNNEKGIAYCLDAKTGKRVHQARLESAEGNRRGPVGKHYASPVLIEGRVYVVLRSGLTYVLSGEPEFKVLAVNRLPADGNTYCASPAVSDGDLFIRSNKCLYCVSRETGWVNLFNGKDLDGWRVGEAEAYAGHGDVRVLDGEIHLDEGRSRTGIAWMGQPPTTNYEISLEAKRRSEKGEVCQLVLPVGPDWCEVVVGLWKGKEFGPNEKRIGLGYIDDKGPHENETTKNMTVETGRWYQIRAYVTDDRVQVWLDEKRAIDFLLAGHDVELPDHSRNLRPLGISTYKTSFAVRNIRLRHIKSEIVKRPAEPKQTARYRTWTNSAGRRIDADLLSFDGTKVTLRRRDGTTGTVPASRLSEADQEWLKRQRQTDEDK